MTLHVNVSKELFMHSVSEVYSLLLPLSRVEVCMGEHHIRVTEGNEQFITSSRAIGHPNYSSYNIDNDIMLIKLSKPATLNQYVQAVALPTSCAAAGTKCLVSGWGNTMSSCEYATLRLTITEPTGMTNSP